MTPKEQLVEALKALCARHGREVVADAIGADEQSLYQIITGVKLPSGNSKGVGPTIQKKLSAVYPGWQTLGFDVAPLEIGNPDAVRMASSRAIYRLLTQVSDAKLGAAMAAIQEALEPFYER